MQPLPQLFDGVKFIEPNQTGLSAEAIKRLDAVRRAYGDTTAAEQQVATAQEQVTAALQDVADAEKIAQRFYQYDINSPAGRSEQQHRLWLQATKGI